MAVAFPSSSAVASSDGGGGASISVSVSPPSGLAAGDTWIIVAVLDKNDSDGVINTPSGFTAAHAQIDGADNGYPGVRTFWKIAGAGESAVSVSASTGVWILWCASIRATGAHATTPIGNVVTTAPISSSTSFDQPDVTIQGDGSGALVIFGGIQESGSTSNLTVPEGVTELQVREGNFTFPSGGVGYVLADTGALAVGSWTLVTPHDRVGITIEVIPAATGGGGTVNTKTLESAIVVADSPQVFMRRNRRLESAIVVTEGETIRSTFTNMTADDAVTVSDDSLQHAMRNRVATDTIDVTDNALWFMLRHRLLESGISLSDALVSSVIGNNVLTRILTSEVLIADEALPRFYRNRLLESDLSVVDEAAQWMLRFRLSESGLSVTDSTLSQIIGGNILFKVLTSEISTADEVLKALLVSRTLSDTIQTDDGLLTSMQRFILLTDLISVDDSQVSSVVSPVTSEPRIVISTDQPRIEIGGRAIFE